MSLEKTYEISFKHALLMIDRNGGIIKEDSVEILPKILRKYALNKVTPI